MTQFFFFMLISISLHSFAQDLTTEVENKIDSVKKIFTEYNQDLFALYKGRQSTMLQFKNLKVNYRKDNLSILENLNGVELKGTITVSADAFRFIDINENFWQEWRLFKGLVISIIKKRGTWRVKPLDAFFWNPLSKPTIEQIKEVYNKLMEDIL